MFKFARSPFSSKSKASSPTARGPADCNRGAPAGARSPEGAPTQAGRNGSAPKEEGSSRKGKKASEDPERKESRCRFSLSTLLKRVDKKLVPLTNGDNTDKHSEPIRIFVGTWNTAFKKLEQSSFYSNTECTCFALKSDRMPCNCAGGFVNPLKDWIDPDYDMYFITLQESVSPNFFEIITAYLAEESSELVRVPLKNDRIMGFGEGAYMSRKMTAVALWVRRDLLDGGLVKVGCARQVYLSSYNRSKGVICLQLKVFDQILCLVGCHMPADYMERQKACSLVLDKLSSMFGASDKLTFKDVFHHVIWAGDFNFKLTTSLDKVVRGIATGGLEALLRYDEFYLPTSTLKDQNFREDLIRFYPTYKKRENRKVRDESDRDWVKNEYSTSDAKWFNGNPERVPSWTDRVFKWSDESMEKCLELEQGSYRAADPSAQTPLMLSDHVPVSCAFCLRPVLKSMALPVKLNVHGFKS